MCGCSSGASAGARTVSPSSFRPTVPTSDTPCIYDLAQVQNWLAKTTCFKEKGLYITYGISNRQLNIYIGTLMSAINYPTNICYFKKQLDEIQGFITLVISTGLC